MIRSACSLTLGGGTWRFTQLSSGVLGGYQTTTALGKDYAARGAENGPLGYPTKIVDCTSDCRVPFENADLSQSQGVVLLIQEPYRSVAIGIATGDPVCGIAGGRCRQTFTDSVAYKLSDGTGVAVSGTIRARWTALGGETGSLGFPLANAVSTASGLQQQFQGGYLAEGYAPYGSPRPVVVIKGGILGRYLITGANTLGAPAEAETCNAAHNLCSQGFDNGRIWWSSAVGAHSVLFIGFLTTYQNRGAATGPLGYPRTELQCNGPNGGCHQEFRSGALWSPTSDWGSAFGMYGMATHGAIGGKYASLNSAWGTLGYPSYEEDCPVSTICHQDFRNGQIWWTPGTGANMLRGGIGAAWNNGGQLVGFPTQDEQCSGPRAGCYQWFQKGIYWWSSQSGVHPVKDGFKAAYERLGWAWGRLGYPTSDEYWTNSGSRQDFQGGSLLWNWNGYAIVIWR
ncbi:MULTISPECIES: hypothetical protein [Arthrobacter]|uniref:LGFP repeat-containing protein n=2 Tax=Arthrobacter TaxID=1663 RepID=A0ABU9KNE8_9MICC|nr:hypothetical protein [Arthrobacter sp. YJM1]MDP5228351.1 hypothetical protein [Arthrobacter sp. YJM1]